MHFDIIRHTTNPTLADSKLAIQMSALPGLLHVAPLRGNGWNLMTDISMNLQFKNVTKKS